ncbi:MAG: tetratricopeptide repeat protein [Melioribacteraceae bacterium]|nr:tetratricopeptide repeat protein [Melioribacteraceae bacterium]
MKRVLSIIMLLSIAIGFSAFQCSSTELTSAKLYIQQDNLDKALESLRQEVSKNPKSDEGFYLLGFVLGEKGDIKGMLDNFDKSTSISNKFAANIEESRKYHWADGFNKGVMTFNKAAKVGDTDSAAVIFNEAIDKFNNAILCQPDSSDTYLNLAYAYINMNNRDAAIEPLKKVLELTKSEDSYVQLSDLYIQKAVAAKEAGKKEEGIALFNESVSVLEEARKLYPDNGDILLLLSNAYIGADKLDVAKEAFREGVEKEPENKFYRYNYGSLLLNANELEPASVQLKKALEIDPDYENAIYNLAVTYVKWGAIMREEMEKNEVESDEYKEKFELALPLLEKYLTIKEDEGAIWDLLGKVYANLGMADKSKNAFEKADLYK